MTPLFTEDVYEAISLETCVKGRVSEGGPSPRLWRNSWRL